MGAKRLKNDPGCRQLCLFSDAEMIAMAEPIEEVLPIEPGCNSAWATWQIEIGQGLRGKEGRRHFRYLTQKRSKPKVVLLQHTELLARAG